MGSDETIILTDKGKEQKLQEREEKRAKVAKGYYDIPEEQMQEIIGRAQQGSTKDQNYLLEIFNNFLEKYINMLRSGHYDLRDYDIKQFIKMYIPSKVLVQKIRNDQLSLKSYKEISSIMKGIFSMIKRYNTEEDIRQTVHMSFIQTLLRYERRGAIPFSGYLYKYFFYILKKNVDDFLISQTGLHSYPLITDDEVSSSYVPEEASGGIYEAAIPKPSQMEDLLGLEDIDEHWVNGDTAEYPFNQLKKFERQLLKWRYVDGLRPNKIAEKTSDHPNTCRQHIKMITAKVKTLVESEAPTGFGD
jgi:hypothetical protein